MKTQIASRLALLAILFFSTTWLQAQTKPSPITQPTQPTTMKTYLIEREIPGAGKLTATDLKSISQTSCSVLDEMGPQIKWIHSYVVNDKIYCVYQAANEELIREHGKQGGFPVNTIMEIKETISPATAK